MFRDVANLICKTATQDQDGYPIETETKIEVFINKKSITRSEFYSSMQAGMNPSIAFELRVEDFELTKRIENGKPVYADKVEFDGATYDIIRTYQKNDSLIELICG